MLVRTKICLSSASYEDIRLAAQVMGVNVKCGGKELKDRYKELVRTNHPDTGGDPARMSQITSANELLTGLSQLERDQFVTRSRFDRRGRNFSGVQYSYTYAAAPAPRVRSVWNSVSSRAKSLVLLEPVQEAPAYSEFSRRCTIVCFLVGAYAFFVGLWNVTSWLSLRSVYRENDRIKNGKLIVLHEERKKLNADVASLKISIRNSRNPDRQKEMAEELENLIRVRKMLNEEIELCVSPTTGVSPVGQKYSDGSSSMSTGLGVGLLFLVLILPRFCRVANFTAY
jgi:curved DNA-binding protein CbpA